MHEKLLFGMPDARDLPALSFSALSNQAGFVHSVCVLSAHFAVKAG